MLKLDPNHLVFSFQDITAGLLTELQGHEAKPSGVSLGPKAQAGPKSQQMKPSSSKIDLDEFFKHVKPFILLCNINSFKEEKEACPLFH